MVHIRKTPDAERHEKMAEAYKRAAWGHASSIESARDPVLRQHHEKKLAESRKLEAQYRELAAKARDAGE